MEYEILESETCEGLKTQVVLAIAERWKPKGGLTVTCYQSPTWGNRDKVVYRYAQAMARKKVNDEH
jgi:hypothetical protein